jgi:hypothetical protein
LFVLIAAILGSCPAFCQVPEPAGSAAQAAVSPPEFESLNQILRRIVLDNVPHTHTDLRDWGQTAQRWSGVQLRREGWKLETERKWATVNHGLWKKYSIRLVDPGQQFAVRFANFRSVDRQTAFDLVVDTPIAIDARQSKWVNGVQLYSLSADAEATVRLTISCQLEMKLDHAVSPPDVTLSPRATAADLNVDRFAVKHISKVSGEVAQQATRWAESRLDELIAEREPKLVDSLNRAIEKHRNDWRVPLPSVRAFSWPASSGKPLPDEVNRELERLASPSVDRGSERP